MLHDVAAGGTPHAASRPGEGGRWNIGRRVRVRVIREDGRAGGARAELSAEGRELVTVGGTKDAIVAHLDKAFGQYMLQKTVTELFGGQRAELGLPCAGDAIPEGDLVVSSGWPATPAQ